MQLFRGKRELLKYFSPPFFLECDHNQMRIYRSVTLPANVQNAPVLISSTSQPRQQCSKVSNFDGGIVNITDKFRSPKAYYVISEFSFSTTRKKYFFYLSGSFRGGSTISFSSCCCCIQNTKKWLGNWTLKCIFFTFSTEKEHVCSLVKILQIFMQSHSHQLLFF